MLQGAAGLPGRRGCPISLRSQALSAEPSPGAVQDAAALVAAEGCLQRLGGAEAPPAAKRDALIRVGRKLLLDLLGVRVRPAALVKPYTCLRDPRTWRFRNRVHPSGCRMRRQSTEP